MASIIRIKRSSVSGNPATLAAGELAYSALADNGSNGGDRLYIGMGTETSGNAANHVVVGGKYFTDMLDHNRGTVTASSALIVDSDKKLNELLVDNLTLNGNTLSSSGDLILSSASGVVLQTSEFIAGGSYGGNRLYLPTGGGAVLQSGYEGGVSLRASTNNSDWVTVTLSDSGSLSVPGTITTLNNGNLTLAPNGTGKLVLNNVFINGTTDTLAEYIYDTVGGAITAGTGITIANSDLDNTSTVSITNTAVTAGSYGSSTAIPTFTVNAQGQLTAAGSTTVATVLNIAGETGTDAVNLLSDTLTFSGTTGITATVTNNTVDISIDNTVATLTGSQTLTNKTINLANNTLTTTSALLAAAVSDETGSGALVFANTPTLVTPNIGAATATSVTGTSGNLAITAFAGNNNVNLVPTGTGTVDVASKRITSLADPTQAQDAATKAYVDAVKTGLDVKDSVRVATVGPITRSGEQLIDGVSAVAGNRVLVKNQGSPDQNGIYVVNASTWTRAIDFDNTPGVEVTGGAFTFVEEGDTNADSGWVLTTNGTITIGTTDLNFVQFSGAGQITAGAGLTKTGNTIDAVGTTNRITVNADSIDIASTYVGQSSITTLGTIGTGIWQGTVVAPTYGGTGVNNGTKTITLGGNLTTSGAFSTTITSTATTDVTLPTSGTLATLTNSETLSNKTITSSSFSGTTIAASGLVTFTNTTDAGPLGTAAVVLSGGLSVAKKIYVGTDIIGAGAATSSIDGFNIEGGTY